MNNSIRDFDQALSALRTEVLAADARGAFEAGLARIRERCTGDGNLQAIAISELQVQKAKLLARIAIGDGVAVNGIMHQIDDAIRMRSTTANPYRPTYQPPKLRPGANYFPGKIVIANEHGEAVKTVIQ